MAEDSITCTVLLFGKAAEIVGKREAKLSLPSNSIAGDIFRALSEEDSEFLNLKSTCAVAVNHTLCTHETPLEDGAVVAILPPVSGG